MIEVSKKILATQIPATTRVVGHCLNGTGDVVVPGEITVTSLMERVVTQKVGAGRQGSAGAFGGPGDRSLVVAGNPDGAFADIAIMRQDILVRGEFEVRDGQGTVRIAVADHVCRYLRGKRLSPHSGCRVGLGVEPHATHSALACIGGTNRKWRSGHQLLQPRRVACQRMEKMLEVRCRVVYVLVQANAPFVSATQRFLEYREQASRDGECLPATLTGAPPRVGATWRRQESRFRGGESHCKTSRHRAIRCGGRFSVCAMESRSHPKMHLLGDQCASPFNIFLTDAGSFRWWGSPVSSGRSTWSMEC